MGMLPNETLVELYGWGGAAAITVAGYIISGVGVALILVGLFLFLAAVGTRLEMEANE